MNANIRRPLEKNHAQPKKLFLFQIKNTCRNLIGTQIELQAKTDLQTEYTFNRYCLNNKTI